MDLLTNLISNYDLFEEKRIKNRFFKHSLVEVLLKSLNHQFQVEKIGNSTLGRSINLIKWGIGSKKIFLWSQMHGDEATATMALFDLMKLLSNVDKFSPIIELLHKNCTLYLLPMLNPDGAEIFSRRNAMEIDINRDFNNQQSPEAIILRQTRDQIEPEFGFNLHDQSTLWSAGDTGNPATISFLAPAYDKELSINSVRKKAMQVISLMNKDIKNDIPDHIARFDDEYEPRAFGDNFQAAGTSTILIEAGGYKNDPEKQFIRKVYLKSILSGLINIANENYVCEEIEHYFSIPENQKKHVQILLKNCHLKRNGIHFKIDIALISLEKINKNLDSTSSIYVLSDIGDLSGFFAYQVINCEKYKITERKEFKIDEPVDFIIHDSGQIILNIKNGILRE